MIREAASPWHRGLSVRRDGVALIRCCRWCQVVRAGGRRKGVRARLEQHEGVDVRKRRRIQLGTRYSYR